MVAYLFYTPPNGPEERQALEFAKQLDGFHVQSQLFEFESRQAVIKRELYDIWSHPSLVLAAEDGMMIGKWEGTLPLASEISYLAHR